MRKNGNIDTNNNSNCCSNDCDCGYNCEYDASPLTYTVELCHEGFYKYIACDGFHFEGFCGEQLGNVYFGENEILPERVNIVRNDDYEILQDS